MLSSTHRPLPCYPLDEDYAEYLDACILSVYAGSHLSLPLQFGQAYSQTLSIAFTQDLVSKLKERGLIESIRSVTLSSLNYENEHPFEFLKEFTNLRALTLHGYQGNDQLKVLETLPLETLSLSNLSAKEIDFSKCFSLKSLRLSRVECPLIIEFNQPALKHLSIKSPRLPILDLRKNTTLEHLSLSDFQDAKSLPIKLKNEEFPEPYQIKSFMTVFRTLRGFYVDGPASGWTRRLTNPNFDPYKFIKTIVLSDSDDTVYELLTFKRGAKLESRSLLRTKFRLLIAEITLTVINHINAYLEFSSEPANLDAISKIYTESLASSMTYCPSGFLKFLNEEVKGLTSSFKSAWMRASLDVHFTFEFHLWCQEIINKIVCTDELLTLMNYELSRNKGTPEDESDYRVNMNHFLVASGVSSMIESIYSSREPQVIWELKNLFKQELSTMVQILIEETATSIKNTVLSPRKQVLTPDESPIIANVDSSEGSFFNRLELFEDAGEILSNSTNRTNSQTNQPSLREDSPEPNDSRFRL